MGFYIRKAISLGGFRFNISKSGVGVSMGIKGLRYGISPRGNYIHMGRGGLYYRSAYYPFSENNKPRGQSLAPKATVQDELKEIESGDVSNMTDSSSAELLQEFKDKGRIFPLFPLSLFIAIGMVVYLLYKDYPDWSIYTSSSALAVLVGLIKLRDILRKTVVLLYNFEPEEESKYSRFVAAFEGLQKCQRIRHVEASGKCTDYKYNAGAKNLLRIKVINVSLSVPGFVKTNIPIPSIPVGKQKLYFFPDRLLVFEGAKVGAVSYGDLKINCNPTRFIEEDGVPSDAQVVDKTWKYVNKNGLPDKRFSYNPEIPIARYEEIKFESPTGLNELIQVSKVGTGNKFQVAAEDLKRRGEK